MTTQRPLAKDASTTARPSRLLSGAPTDLRIAVVGCGAIGGVVAAHLVEAGLDVTAVTHNPSIAAAISQHGLTAALSDDRLTTVRFPAVVSASDLDDGADFDLVLLAVPPNNAVDAVRAIGDRLADGARIVCLPNGLMEERLAASVPELDASTFVGGIVAFGATMSAPGKVRRTAAGGVALGRIAPREHDPELDAIESVLAHVGPVQRTTTLRGARWSKLAINCAISSLGTVGGDTLGVLMRQRFVRRLALETMTEVVEIARAEGVSLEKVSGTLDLEWLAMDADERLRSASPALFAKHAVLLAVGAKYRKMRSSMLAAVERGREPSVDFLNGEITSRAGTHGIATPINQALQDAVHAVARGEHPSSMATLRAVYDRTRPVLRELQMVA